MGNKRGDRSHKANSYASYLHKGEKPSKHFSIGGYRITATKTKVVIEKSLHKLLVAFRINDVESVEYTTEVKWNAAITSFFWLAFSYVFYFELGTSKISFWSFFFNLEGIIYVIKLLALLFFVFGLVALHHFIASFTGRLKIRLANSVIPIEIYTPFNKQVPEFIGHIEDRRKS